MRNTAGDKGVRGPFIKSYLPGPDMMKERQAGILVPVACRETGT
jgi:hypothetical protein